MLKRTKEKRYMHIFACLQDNDTQGLMITVCEKAK